MYVKVLLIRRNSPVGAAGVRLYRSDLVQLRISQPPSVLRCDAMQGYDAWRGAWRLDKKGAGQG